MPVTRLLLASTATLLATGVARAQYAEGFDSQASADVTIQAEPDTNVMFVDYSNMTIGGSTFSIPEAPRRIPGSAATSGILMQANLTAAATAAVNVLAGATPITFSGRYRVSFDAWQNVPVNPSLGGSTEQMLWGVSVDGIAPLECRHNLALGAQGIYGWLAGENGYSLEDAVICEAGTRVGQLGDQQTGQGVFFNEAFDQPWVPTAPNNAPANQWVRVDIDVDQSLIRVYFNGVEFFNYSALVPPSGFAMIGYEDPFTSLGTQPDDQWGLFDNFRVTVPAACAAQGSSMIQGTATDGEILSGAADPMVGAPMTIRLRGGPSSGLALLNMGFPSPITIPIPLGGCTLMTEVLGNLANLIVVCDTLGNSNFTIEVPAGTGLCGGAFGFQYFFLGSSPCGVVHTEGLALTIGS
ncbi:MAG: hypothetical protein KDE27_07340 [Planctomycetes bacterium]|nr:hypothetical protein [Planctomycetota bacterium]